MKIIHISTLHRRDDPRIFGKMCVSMTKRGHDVTYLVNDRKEEEVVNGVKVVSITGEKGICKRIFTVARQMFSYASRQAPDLIVFHDPELCLVGLFFPKAWSKIVYDVHEDFPRQYATNSRLSKKWIARLIGLFIGRLETMIAARVRGITCATEGIAVRFRKYSENVCVVRNYPVVEELSHDRPWSTRRHQACYVGGLRNTRGIKQIVNACAEVGIPLKLAGPWQPSSYAVEVSSEVGWANTEYLGYLERTDVRELLSQSKVAFLLLDATPNHLLSLPVKLFEYMCAGVPVVASAFPSWQRILRNRVCGVTIDPRQSSEELVPALHKILSDPGTLEEMSINGPRVVAENYSWSNEASRLLDFLE